jgi:hypothetical protein
VYIFLSGPEACDIRLSLYTLQQAVRSLAIKKHLIELFFIRRRHTSNATISHIFLSKGFSYIVQSMTAGEKKTSTRVCFS